MDYLYTWYKYNAVLYTKKRSTFGNKTHISLKNDDTWNYALKKYFVFIVTLLGKNCLTT